MTGRIVAGLSYEEEIIKRIQEGWITKTSFDPELVRVVGIHLAKRFFGTSARTIIAADRPGIALAQVIGDYLERNSDGKFRVVVISKAAGDVFDENELVVPYRGSLRLVMKRGDLAPGEEVLIVDDRIETGETAQRLMELALDQAQALVAGIAVIEAAEVGLASLAQFFNERQMPPCRIEVYLKYT